MSQHTIISRDIKGFDTYIRNTNAYLLLSTLIEGVSTQNSTRYNWTAAQLTAWQGFLASWLSLYPKWDDKKGQRTEAIEIDLKAIITNAINYDKAQKLIALIRATTPLVALDCTTFNLPKSLVTPLGHGGTVHLPTTGSTARTKPTMETIFAKLIPQTGGFVHNKLYEESAETGRPHKLKGFDLIEYSYGVFYSDEPNKPTDPADPRLKIAHSSKASFILPTAGIVNNLHALAAGAVPPAKVLIIWFRWAKSKHPDLDGPWSVMYITVLL